MVSLQVLSCWLLELNAVMPVLLLNIVLTSKSVNETVLCDHSNEYCFIFKFNLRKFSSILKH